jgi:hypothetical protein
MFEGANLKLTLRHVYVYVYVYAQVRWVQCSAVGTVLCSGRSNSFVYPYTAVPVQHSSFCPVDFCVSSSFGLADQLSCGAFCFTKCRLQIIFLFHGKF